MRLQDQLATRISAGSFCWNERWLTYLSGSMPTQRLSRPSSDGRRKRLPVNRRRDLCRRKHSPLLYLLVSWARLLGLRSLPGRGVGQTTRAISPVGALSVQWSASCAAAWSTIYEPACRARSEEAIHNIR